MLFNLDLLKDQYFALKRAFKNKERLDGLDTSY